MASIWLKPKVTSKKKLTKRKIRVREYGRASRGAHAKCPCATRAAAGILSTTGLAPTLSSTCCVGGVSRCCLLDKAWRRSCRRVLKQYKQTDNTNHTYILIKSENIFSDRVYGTLQLQGCTSPAVHLLQCTMQENSETPAPVHPDH